MRTMPDHTMPPPEQKGREGEKDGHKEIKSGENAVSWQTRLEGRVGQRNPYRGYGAQPLQRCNEPTVRCVSWMCIHVGLLVCHWVVFAGVMCTALRQA